jgi:predicted dehydrogenase
MYLTPEQKVIGHRNFWRAAGRGVDLNQLKLETCVPRTKAGDPIRGGIVGLGSQGYALLGQCLSEVIEIQAICDINPAHRTRASQWMMQKGEKQPREYENWQEMAQKENLEVVIIATPLWTHADIAVGFLNAGVHVLCEKMMAYDVPSCHRMLEAAKRQHRLLEIGYARFYEPVYRAAYKNIIQTKVLGDIHYVRLHTHRNNSWRRDDKPPFSDYNPTRWGYPTWEALSNWRMYKHYSQGLVAELGSHQTSMIEWYLGTAPLSVYGSGGIYRYKDGREVNDHIFMTFEHPGGCTVELSVILSNDYGGLYEEFLGSKGSLIVSDVDGGMLFTNGGGYVEVAPVSGRDETAPWSPDWRIAFRTEIWNFCSAVRRGSPLFCGPERALNAAAVALAGNNAIDERTRVEIPAASVGQEASPPAGVAGKTR